MWLFLGISAIIFTGFNLICSFKITDNDLKSLCSVDILYLFSSTASARKTTMNPNPGSGAGFLILAATRAFLSRARSFCYPGLDASRP